MMQIVNYSREAWCGEEKEGEEIDLKGNGVQIEIYLKMRNILAFTNMKVSKKKNTEFTKEG
jgi:hypothetical protein